MMIYSSYSFMSFFLFLVIAAVYYFVVECFVKKNTIVNSTVNKALSRFSLTYRLPE